MSQSYCSTAMQFTRCRCAPRRGMTLVEMLVAMALSLIVILAVTQVFRLVGDNVLAGRAITEMSGQLRSASDQLRRDLGSHTVPVRPWIDATSGLGYFEILEGPFWDMGLGPIATGTPVPGKRYSQTGFGDFDDVLMFTARSDDFFQGLVSGNIIPDPARPGGRKLVYDPTVRTVIQAKYAEIVWFTRWDDRNRDAQPDPSEVTLHRRVFLILPDLDISDPTLQSLTPGQFYNSFDLSIRYQPTASGGFVKLPNSLQTLTLRQNRIGHQIAGAFPADASGTLVNQGFPYPLRRILLAPQGTTLTPGPDGDWGVSGVDDDGVNGTDDIGEGGTFGSDDLALPLEMVYAGQPWAVTLGETYGSDVILSQVLAFDVRVYDPAVSIQQSAAAPPQAGVPPTPEAVLPGDPGYLLGGTTAGHGGYVDLFYSRYIAGAFPIPSPMPASISSQFAGLPQVRSGLRGTSFPPTVLGEVSPAYISAVYDTGTMFYEHDGVDQDGNGIVDQGTNGVDDDGVNGVDDVGERETSPPYPVPLRGIQVRIRIIDPDSRQVRQVTVSSDFVPE